MQLKLFVASGKLISFYSGVSHFVVELQWKPNAFIYTQIHLHNSEAMELNEVSEGVFASQCLNEGKILPQVQITVHPRVLL